MHFMIWTKAFYDLDKYILGFGQILLESGQIQCANKVLAATSSVLTPITRQIHLAIWTNIFHDLDKFWNLDHVMQLKPPAGISVGIYFHSAHFQTQFRLIKVDGEICQSPNFQQYALHIFDLHFLNAYFHLILRYFVSQHWKIMLLEKNIFEIFCGESIELFRSRSCSIKKLGAIHHKRNIARLLL